MAPACHVHNMYMYTCGCHFVLVNYAGPHSTSIALANGSIAHSVPWSDNVTPEQDSHACMHSFS